MTRAIALLLMLLPVSAAAVAPTTSNEAPGRLYRVAWGGFHVGDITFAFNDLGNRYATRLVLDAQGAARTLFRFNLEAASEGVDAQNGKLPTLWSFRSLSPKADRMLQLKFNPKTGDAGPVRDEVLRLFVSAEEADLDPPPPVPAELKKNVLDPLTALFQMQDRIRAGQSRFILPVYDGRRRFDLDTTVIGPDRHNILGREFDTVDLRITFHPIAGWRDRHLRSWNNAEFEMYLDRTSLLPVKVTTDNFMAAMVISYVGDCSTQLRCPPRLGLQEAILPQGR